jgi:uncharacterized protein (TIGR02145 family)
MGRLRFYYFLTAVILLLSLSTIVYSGTFTDTFDDPSFTSSNWTTYATGAQQNWSHTTLNGTDLGYHASASGEDTIAVKLADNGAEYDNADLLIETLFRLDSHPENYTAENIAGVAFSFVTQTPFYHVGIEQDYNRGTDTIFFSLGIDEEENYTEMPVDISFDTFYKLVVQMDSTTQITARLYALDGTLMGTLSMDNILSLQRGAVAIYGGPEVTFNNFKINPAPVDPSGRLTSMQVAQLYVATFNRAPDAGGLNFWANTSGLAIEGVAEAFFKAPETQRKYPEGTTDAAFVNTIYQNVFGRDAEPAGLNYWVNVLGNGWRTRDQMIMTVIEGARNKDLKVLQNKTEVGLYYAEEVGGNHIDGFKFSLANITDDPATVYAAMVVVNGFVDEPVPSSPCGAFVAPGIWKEFDCYNLAAIGKTTGVDPFTPSWELNGGYWQWGRKGPDPSQWYDTNTPHFAHGPTGEEVGDANEGEISVWDQTDAPDDAWSDSEKTAKDPCPIGFRVPTLSQWVGILGNNAQSIVGTWPNSHTNYSSARFFGSDLMLPAAGYREYTGALNDRGKFGYYWSSSEGSSSNYAWYLNFGSDFAGSGHSNRLYGFSVRCISE